MLLECLLAVVSYRGETQCVGNVHNVSSKCVADFDLILINININDKIIVLVDQM